MRIIPLTVIAAMGVYGCGQTTAGDEDIPSLPEPVEITLAFGESRTIEGTALGIAFTHVNEDSRCPTDVTCVWQGNAEVALSIGLAPNPSSPLLLNTGVDPQTARWAGVGVTLLSLSPDPLAEEPIDPEDYVVTVRLEPLE
jgi:hypothetical protein